MDLGLRSLVFARYQDKRWVPRDAKERSSSRVNEEDIEKILNILPRRGTTLIHLEQITG